jgi:hypothetical protein
MMMPALRLSGVKIYVGAFIDTLLLLGDTFSYFKYVMFLHVEKHNSIESLVK